MADKTDKKGMKHIDEEGLVGRSTTWISALREDGFPWRKALLAVIVLGLLGVMLFALKNVLTPIVLAAALAYVFDPLVDRLEARGWSRVRSIAVLLAIIFIGTGGVIAALVPIFGRQVQDIGEKLPEYRQAIETSMDERIVPFLQTRFGIQIGAGEDTVVEVPEGQLTYIADDPDLWTQVSSRLSSAAPSLAGALAQAGNWVAGNALSALLLIVNILLIPVFAFYFLRDWDKITSRARDMIPERTREKAVVRFKEVDTVLGKFLRGQLSVCLILAVLYSIGLGVLGCPMWLVVGVVSGFAFLIPYLGTAVGIALGASLTLFHFGFGPSVGWLPVPGVLLVIAWFVIVQVIESYLITPKIVGESVGLHPVVVIVAIIAGGELLGFLGMLLAVPLTAAGAVFVRASMETYRESSFYRTM